MDVPQESNPLAYATPVREKKPALPMTAFVLGMMALTLIVMAHLVFRRVLVIPINTLSVMAVEGLLFFPSIALGCAVAILSVLAWLRTAGWWPIAAVVTAVAYWGFFIWAVVKGAL